MSPKKRSRKKGRAEVLDSGGHRTGDAQLLREAIAEAEVWAARVRSGKTREDRCKPVCSSGVNSPEVAISHLPQEARVALEDELYAVDSGE